MSRTVLLVPCYNEQRRLVPGAFLEFVCAHADIELLFVDDGSQDDTPTILAGLCQQHKSLSCLRLGRNQGKAEAVRQGFLKALERQPDYIGYWDADLATPLEVAVDFRDFLDLHPQVELLLGSRVKLLGKSIERHLSRHYLGRIFATAVSVLMNLPVYDTQCGNKLMRTTPTVKEAMARPFVTNWIFDVELIARLLRCYRAQQRPELELLYEYPVPRWKDVEGSKVRPLDFVRAPLELWKLYWAELRYL
ncbi:MAG: glycosyltransferase [Vulcanimicrobiota bacterium]